jgi:catechol 2,3-dioxygenase-like lactoylglutathione lyase family enzyme
MYDHIGLKVRDLAASLKFYRAALKPLGHVAAPATTAAPGSVRRTRRRYGCIPMPRRAAEPTSRFAPAAAPPSTASIAKA